MWPHHALHRGAFAKNRCTKVLLFFFLPQALSVSIEINYEEVEGASSQQLSSPQAGVKQTPLLYTRCGVLSSTTVGGVCRSHNSVWNRFYRIFCSYARNSVWNEFRYFLYFLSFSIGGSCQAPDLRIFVARFFFQSPQQTAPRGNGYDGQLQGDQDLTIVHANFAVLHHDILTYA